MLCNCLYNISSTTAIPFLSCLVSSGIFLVYLSTKVNPSGNSSNKVFSPSFSTVYIISLGDITSGRIISSVVCLKLVGCNWL